jgi:PKD repeat protein
MLLYCFPAKKARWLTLIFFAKEHEQCSSEASMRCKIGRISKYPARNSRFLFILLIAILLLCSTAIGTVGGVETLQITISSVPATVSAGNSAQILVTATYYGQPMSGATVVATTNTGSATLTPSSGLTDSSGKASFGLDTTSSTSGTVRVSATVTKQTIDANYAGNGYVDIPVQPVVMVPLEPVVLVSTTTPVPQPQPAVNQQPVAIIAVDKSTGQLPLTINFDGRDSYDPDGSINSYAWDFGDGSTGSGYIASHTYTTPGTFVASLVVTDDNGLPSNPATTPIIVQSTAQVQPQPVYQPPQPKPVYQPPPAPPYQPPAPQQPQPAGAQAPVAVISVDNYAGDVPLTVTFDGRQSYAPGGSVVTYAWDFGDGSTGTGYIAQHQYATPGTYTASLVVTDNTMASSAPAAIRIFTVSSIGIPVNETGGDRHYIVNTSSGTVVFGNGSHGLVPETGGDNISAGYYRADDNGIAGLIPFALNPFFFPVRNGIENSSEYLASLLNRPGSPLFSASYTTAGFAAQTYGIGVDGVTFRQDPLGVMTLEINYPVAQQAGAVIDIHDTYITVYQRHPSGVLLTFHGDRFTQEHEIIYGRVTKAEFQTDPLITNMSYGIVGGSLTAEMFSLPKDAQVDIVIREKNDAEVINRFNNAAERNGLIIDAIAYTFDVRRRNFNTTGAANISLTIPVSWVDRHGGKDSVRIARIGGQTGPVEFLRTSYAGPDRGGNLVFYGISPNGTSIFGLITAHEISARQQESGKIDIFPGTMPAIMTDIGMLSWLLGPVLENPLMTVVVIIILSTIAFAMWLRR